MGLATNALFRIKENKLLLILLFAISLGFFIYSQRNSDFFILISAYIILEGAECSKLKEFWGASRRKMITSLLFSLSCLVLTANILHIWNSKIIDCGQIKKGISLRLSPGVPDTEVLFLKNNRISGRIFNDILYGGYLLGTSYPDSKIFVDGRQTNQEAIGKYIAAVTRPNTFWPMIEKEFQFDIVLIHSANPANQKLLNYFLHVHNLNWKLIFVGKESAIFVKGEKFMLPDELKFFEEKLKTTGVSIENIEQRLKEHLPAKKSLLNFVKEFIFPEIGFDDNLSAGINLYDLGYKKAGLAAAEKAFNLTKSDATRQTLFLMMEDFKKFSLSK